ncbi:MAG: hypothetical protein ABSA40_02380 [Candidatus Dormibacteria bacterium]
MESEQICPACATINATGASTCTSCSSALSRPDQPAAAPPDASKPAGEPVVIRPAKGFRIFDGGGLSAPRPASTALSVVEQPEAASATTPGGAPAAVLEASPPEAVAPEATPPQTTPPEATAPAASPPAPAPPGHPLPLVPSASNGHATRNGWPEAPRVSSPPELIFAIEGTVVAAPSSPSGTAPAAPPAGPAPASPLAFHVDAASVPGVAPLTFQTAEPPAPAPTGEAGGRGWGIREQRPNPTANWSTTPPSIRDDPGSSAIGVPRQIAGQPQAAAAPGAANPELEPRSGGAARVLRVGMLVLLIVVVMFGALIYYGGR